MPVLRLNHIALVTDDLDAALRLWRDILGLEVEAVRDVPQEGVRVAFLPLGESHIELVLPTQPNTGVARFLEKRGPGMHHLCLEVDDLDALVPRLKAQGIQLTQATPQVSPAGYRYIFLHPKSTGGVLVELYERPKNP